jgi:glutamine amidotransferase
MARLFALLGNRSDLAGKVLAAEADVLRARTGGACGWGVGFYQGGEVLIRRRPIDDRPEIDVARVAGDVRSDVVLGQVRLPTVGALRTENTHPFRYRQWLYAQTGSVSAFDALRERLVATLPEFLRAGIRGDTDAEVLFHVFLSFLHDQGRLQGPAVDGAVVAEALRSTLAVVDGMAAEVGAGPCEVNVMVTDGEFVVGMHRRERMAYRVFSGRQDADLVLGDDHELRRRTPELAQMHFVVLAADLDVRELPPRWKPVQDRAIVTVIRGHEPKIIEA